MNGFWAVCKRELKGYFATPVAYVFLVIFLFGAGYLTFSKGKFFDARQADMRLFFEYLPLLFILMVPATAMRLWSEERRSGSIELLLTLPIMVRQAVLGKFVAAWIFLGLALALTFPMPLTLAYLGAPDWGTVIAGYLGSFLMAGAYLAVGAFFSALSKNQVISFILAAVACAVLLYLGMPSTLNYLTGNGIPSGMVSLIGNLSFQTHFDSLQRGVLDLRDIFYFLFMIAGWNLAGTFLLEERKAA